MTKRDGLPSVTLDIANATCLRRLEEDVHLVEALVLLGQVGMASGIDESFDTDAFVQCMPNQL